MVLDYPFYKSPIYKVADIREDQMDNLSFGFTMLVVGMGGTLVALSVLSLLMGLLKKLFPAKEDGSN